MTRATVDWDWDKCVIISGDGGAGAYDLGSGALLVRGKSAGNVYEWLLGALGVEWRSEPTLDDCRVEPNGLDLVGTWDEAIDNQASRWGREQRLRDAYALVAGIEAEIELASSNVA